MREDHKARLNNIGMNLRRIRQDKGYSQQDLSNKCDVERAKISRIENASEDVRLSTLLKIADALEIDLVELVRKDDKKI